MSLLDILESVDKSIAISSPPPKNSFVVLQIENKPSEKPESVAVHPENACPKCGSTQEWLPRLANDDWKCAGCSPPLHRALVAETRERRVFGDDRVFFDPVTVCVEKQVCRCGSRWLDLTMNGYRCGCCNGPISMNSDQIFWGSDDFSSLNGGLELSQNERIFSK